MLISQYSEPWIVFDRDQVKRFDLIIYAAKEKGINAGWSNPCIEIWFYAYFGEMPTYHDSVSCCNGFEQKYFQAVGQKYEKSDPAIYSKLCRFGNANQAIEIAEQKYAEHQKNCKSKPSEMCPATTIHLLISEIIRKTH